MIVQRRDDETSWSAARSVLYRDTVVEHTQHTAQHSTNQRLLRQKSTKKSKPDCHLNCPHAIVHSALCSVQQPQQTTALSPASTAKRSNDHPVVRNVALAAARAAAVHVCDSAGRSVVRRPSGVVLSVVLRRTCGPRTAKTAVVRPHTCIPHYWHRLT